MSAVAADTESVHHDAHLDQYLTDYSPTDKPWDVHRLQADAVAVAFGVVGGEWWKYARRVNDCSGRLTFGWTQPNSDGETRPKLVGARFCRVRTCPICQWRRSLMHKARLLERLPVIYGRNPGARWIFLTLTVRNVPLSDLRVTIQAMNRGFTAMARRKDWPALGWVRSCEVTRGADGSAHPHFHALLMVPPSYFKGGSYMKQATWVEWWRKAMKLDYDPVVDVRAVKPGKNGDGMDGAVAEALKYAVKPEAMSDPEWLVGFTEQARSLRFVDSGGELRGVLADDYQDLIHVEDKPGEEVDEESPVVHFDWQRKEKRYKRKQRSDDV